MNGLQSSVTLDTEPYFAAEAQETFLVGERIFAVEDTMVAKKGSEGVYLGRTRAFGAFVRWDTPNGEGYTQSIGFDSIRNLYR